MRGHVRGWTVEATVAAVAAALVVVPMAVLLIAVQADRWRLGSPSPAWLPALLLVAVSPLAAVPGCLTSYVAGHDRRSRRIAAVASLAGGLIGGLAGGSLIATSMLWPWAGMALASLAAVTWRERVGYQDPGTARPPAANGGWTAVDKDELEVRVEGPRSRLVARDVLAPPEGWDVPLTLPDRSAAPRPGASNRPADT